MSDHAYLLDGVSASGSPALQKRREAAASWFRQHGFPSRHQEAWRFTPLTTLTSRHFTKPLPIDQSIEAYARLQIDLLRDRGFDGYFLVYINGTCFASLSDFASLTKLKGVEAGCLANPDVLAKAGATGSLENWEDTPFAALNTASFRSGVWLSLQAGVQLEQPVIVVHIVQGDVCVQHRNLFELAQGSRATVIEIHADSTAQHAWHNSVGEALIGANACLTHHRIQTLGDEGNLSGAFYADVAKDGRFEDGSFAFGAGLSRQNIVCRLNGQGAWASLTGLYLLDDDRVADHHTRLEHNAAHCSSEQLYKGILDGRSRGIFNGRVVVAQDAQKTNANQSSKVLLLSDNAVTDANPELEIYADDVRCTHGSTTGFLNEEAVFYLRSRGVPQPEARRMIVQAFAAEVADTVEIPALKNRILDEISHRLGSR